VIPEFAVAYGGRAQKLVYRHLPQGLRNIAATYYALRTYPTRHGPHFHECFERLREHERLPNAELEAIQVAKLRALVDHASRSVPYYRSLFRERGITAGAISSLADLARVPLLTKDAVRKHHGELLAEGARTDRLVCVHTSGTTGTPLDLYQTKELFQKEYAFWWFHRSWAGVHLGDRTATLAGHPVAPVEQDRPPFWVRNYRENQMLFSSYHLSERNLSHYCDALVAFRPEFVHGYPSSIYFVALGLNDRGITSVRPRAVFASSETVLSHQRAEIERAFGCRLHGYYGNAERAGYIGECEHGGLHAMSEHSVTEVLDEDGQPAAPGQPGVLVCTNIDGTAMPLIRYVTGDIVVPLPDGATCACGRGGRLVESVLGRVEDYVVTPEGSYVGRLDHIFKGVGNVREAQLLQPSRGRLIIRVVKDPAFSEGDRKALIDNARERLGRSIDIVVDFVDSIERTKTGKFRFIVSEVPREERLRAREHG
jgi:phenylacetate-CoA ligase